MLIYTNFIGESNKVQTTIKKEISAEGFGIHTGTFSSITLKPYKVNGGICFEKNEHIIKASVDNIISGDYCTKIGQSGIEILTIEHLMAALYLSKVDNCLIDVKGTEIPIFDGTISKFMNIIQDAGIKHLGEKRKNIIIKKNQNFTAENSNIELIPSSSNYLTCDIRLENNYLGSNEIEFSNKNESVIEKTVKARTFGFIQDFPNMLKNGIGLGAGMHNCIIFNNNNCMNAGGLKFPNEPIWHKAADLLGDLYLTGRRISGHIKITNPGHKINHILLKAILTVC